MKIHGTLRANRAVSKSKEVAEDLRTVKSCQLVQNLAQIPCQSVAQMNRQICVYEP